MDGSGVEPSPDVSRPGSISCCFAVMALVAVGAVGSSAAGPLGSIAAMTYRIDAEASELVVKLFKAGPAARFAHDHVVRATDFSGTVDVDPADPTTARVQVTVQADGLRADEPSVRERYGLEKALDEDDRQKIQRTMEGTDQLGVEEYPTIEFRSTAVEEDGDGRVRLRGELTLHDVTREMTIPAEVEFEESRLCARGSFRFAQSAFGIEPYSFMLGAVRNRDEVELVFEIIATSDAASRSRTPPDRR